MREKIMEDTQEQKILVIHGPNLNMLGKREPQIYGRTTLEEIDEGLKDQGQKVGILVETFQSNYEGAIVEKIQETFFSGINGIIINPAAFTHTSVAIRDALLLLDAPIIEIHISNIYKRELFRHKSMVADIATAQISGFGVIGYALALDGLIRLIKPLSIQAFTEVRPS
jgi:3-dehydroquinate dehydratase-2